MGKSKEIIKWVFVGTSVALVISGIMYLTFPKVEVLGNSKESVEGSDYSATIYGAPDIDLEHYRLSEDKYFDYLIKGDLDVGRLDPSTYSRWYKGLIEEAFREYVLYKESGMEEGSIYDISEDNIGAFASWYKSEYTNKEEVAGLSVREIEEVIFKLREVEEEKEEESEEESEGVEDDELEGTEKEDGEEEVEEGKEDSKGDVEGEEDEDVKNEEEGRKEDNDKKVEKEIGESKDTEEGKE